MSVFTFEIVRHGEAPVIADVLRLPDERAIWCRAEALDRTGSRLSGGGLGIALALHEAGHVVSIVNPAQIRDFARTKLGRNKTDQVDAVHIREYAELFKPRPWIPPSPAMRRLCELQTIRAGTVAGLRNGRIAAVAA